MTSYSQRDARWAGQLLGAGPQTIGEAGCLMTAVASALQDLDASWRDPGELNAWLYEHGGYAAGNDLIWAALDPLGVRVCSYVDCGKSPAPVELIRQAICLGAAPLLKVDWWPGGDVQEHWVRALGVCGNDLTVMDPYQPAGHEEVQLLEFYGAHGWDLARAILFVVILARAGNA